jgi:hypothetical protein
VSIPRGCWVDFDAIPFGHTCRPCRALCIPFFSLSRMEIPLIVHRFGSDSGCGCHGWSFWPISWVQAVGFTFALLPPRQNMSVRQCVQHRMLFCCLQGVCYVLPLQCGLVVRWPVTLVSVDGFALASRCSFDVCSTQRAPASDVPWSTWVWLWLWSMGACACACSSAIWIAACTTAVSCRTLR